MTRRLGSSGLGTDVAMLATAMRRQGISGRGPMEAEDIQDRLVAIPIKFQQGERIWDHFRGDGLREEHYWNELNVTTSVEASHVELSGELDTLLYLYTHIPNDWDWSHLTAAVAMLPGQTADTRVGLRIDDGSAANKVVLYINTLKVLPMQYEVTFDGDVGGTGWGPYTTSLPVGDPGPWVLQMYFTGESWESWGVGHRILPYIGVGHTQNPGGGAKGSLSWTPTRMGIWAVLQDSDDRVFADYITYGKSGAEVS